MNDETILELDGFEGSMSRDEVLFQLRMAQKYNQPAYIMARVEHYDLPLMVIFAHADIQNLIENIDEWEIVLAGPAEDEERDV